MWVREFVTVQCQYRTELMDAFGAMGVMVKPQLMDVLLHQLEKDDRGRVDYQVLLSMLGGRVKG